MSTVTVFFLLTIVDLGCLISSEFRGCRGRSVLLTPALPCPPGHPQKSEGNEKERMEDPVWAQQLVEAPQWRRSLNSVECPTLWGPLLFFTILRWAFFSEDLFFLVQLAKWVTTWYTIVFQEEQDIKALQAKNRKLGESLDQRQVSQSSKSHYYTLTYTARWIGRF